MFPIRNNHHDRSEATLALTTCFGSGSASFQVGDPTPVITGVSPNNWPAGAQTSFIITGSGFGTAPTLSVTGNGVTGSAITSSTDTQINATVTVAPDAPSGIATITVTSTRATLAMASSPQAAAAGQRTAPRRL